MKRAVVVMAGRSFWAGSTTAQTNSITPIETQSVEVSTTLIGPGDQQSPNREFIGRRQETWPRFSLAPGKVHA